MGFVNSAVLLLSILTIAYRWLAMMSNLQKPINIQNGLRISLKLFNYMEIANSWINSLIWLYFNSNIWIFCRLTKNFSSFYNGHVMMYFVLQMLRITLSVLEMHLVLKLFLPSSNSMCDRIFVFPGIPITTSRLFEYIEIIFDSGSCFGFFVFHMLFWRRSHHALWRCQWIHLFVWLVFIPVDNAEKFATDDDFGSKTAVYR